MLVQTTSSSTGSPESLESESSPSTLSESSTPTNLVSNPWPFDQFYYTSSPSIPIHREYHPFRSMWSNQQPGGGVSVPIIPHPSMTSYFVLTLFLCFSLLARPIRYTRSFLYATTQ